MKLDGFVEESKKLKLPDHRMGLQSETPSDDVDPPAKRPG
jgi:hypothetical protein